MRSLFYRDKRLLVLVVLMIFSAGISGLLTIGRQEDPTITNLFATIVTPYPGAGPERVEALVTEKIEDELRQIEEVNHVTSTSRTGISVIQIELSQFISDVQIDQTWSRIRDALADASANFPAGVPEPVFDNDRTGAFTSIVALIARDGRRVSDAVNRRYAELLQDRLRGLSGTKFVQIYGAQTEEIQVTIDPVKLTSIGLTAEAVSAAIRRADSKVSAGQIRGDRANLLIEVTGEIKSLERIARIPILESDNSRIVRVSDVASVMKTVRKPPTSIAIADGNPAVLIAARMQDDLQVDAWTNKVNAIYADFRNELPSSLELRVLFDQSSYTATRLAGVVENMAIGIALVVGVLLLTLGWRAALIVAIILPLATLLSISGLRLVGIPIHQMSVTGLIVALGLLVDAGIVMTDDIRRRLTAGMSRLKAVEEAVGRLSAPLLASTLTTALAFMPMALLPGPAGDFVGAIAIAVIIMLFASLALALTLTPALAGWLLPETAQSKDKAAQTSGLFGWSIALALARPRLAILLSLVLPAIGFGAFPTLKAQFFPGVDRNQFYVQLKLPDGSAISETQRIALKTDALIREESGVRAINWVIGESAPAFYYNMIADQDNEPSFAEALVTTASSEATEAMLGRLQRLLDAGVPQARIIVRGLAQGPPVSAPVEIRIAGSELATLRELGERVRRIMIEVPDIIQARTQLAAGAPKVIVDLDEEKVRLAGLQLSDIARQLDAALEGSTGGSLIEGSEELPVRVRVGEQDRRDFKSVRAIDVLAPDAQARAQAGAYPGIPLTALGTLKLQPAVSPIYRRNGERINTIQGFVHRDVLPEEALKKVRAKISESGLKLPAGYRFEIGGDADARDDVLRNLISSLGIIVALSIASIVMTLGSYRLSLVTGIVAVLSMGLSLLALAVFGYPFGIQAVIGVIGSIGVSINAAIIIMTALKDDPSARGGNLERIGELVVTQSRHIISTTLTTFGGFLPLILDGGGFWPPFAMAIAGGVLLSTIISFYFIPPAFALLARRGGLLSVGSNTKQLILKGQAKAGDITAA
ncbi:MAG: efflux RND transporter permease subunit [Pseudomonadota bacterium]